MGVVSGWSFWPCQSLSGSSGPVVIQHSQLYAICHNLLQSLEVSQLKHLNVVTLHYIILYFH